MRILILYEELAWYFVNCLNVTAQKHNVSMMVICKKPNTVAPFRFPFVHENISILERDSFSAEELLQRIGQFSPDKIFLAGWSNKFYKQIVRKLRLPTAIGFDNQWTGSLKQRVGAIVFRMSLKKYFQRAFVPGSKQMLFAKHLGFSDSDIVAGAYCCDYKMFDDYRQKFAARKEVQPPHRFLYVGRYAPEKGIEALWQGFIEWKREAQNDWELWCVGKGALSPVQHPAIRHFDFVQPDAMDEIIGGTSVFILPSRFEPWGVVVHEFAAAGFPLLCSAQTGAAQFFLEDGKNGFVIEGGNKEQIKEKLNKFSSMNAGQLRDMAQHSAQLAAKITPSLWADGFMKLFSI